MTRIVRLVVLVAFATSAALCIPNTVQAHEKLKGHWKEKESDGRWFIKFEHGQKNGDTWRGKWEGKLHHTQKEHRGHYVLVMQNEHEGTLTMYENGQKLAEATVHLGDGHLKYGNAHYHRV
ncbi:MAG: hypothetical protein ACJ8F7_06330 [Gemmataceae bacterium]